MKKLILIFTLLTTLLSAGEIKWVEDYDDAIEMAQKNNKVVMVMLSREGCPACEYMEDIVFTNDEVLKILNKDFIPVHIDIYKGFVPDGLTYIGTPTFHFVNKNEKIIDTLVGGKNSKTFMEKLSAVIANR